MMRLLGAALAAALAVPMVSVCSAQTSRSDSVARAQWNAPQQPFRIFGNTYYVGTHGLASILITSPAGDVLIDGALPESAPLVLANIRRLGVDLRRIRVILNSHAHFDHAGGIAALQRRTGAAVEASPWSARVLEAGHSLPGDPQLGVIDSFPAVRRVRVLSDGQTVRVGSIALTAHFTPGHTPGGTTWTWRSCQDGRCLDLVYADSQTPVSENYFFFTRNTTYPAAVSDFARSAATIAALPCDILLTPHPGASDFWDRVGRRDAGDSDALVDSNACKRFATTARQQVAERVRRESPAHDTMTIQSRALGEPRLINVHTPVGYAADAARRYPVLYMPDGGMDEDFPHVVATVDSLIALREIRPVIVVGIPNTQRRRDLTGPTRVKADSAIAPRVGGSAAFRRFMSTELFSAIDSLYRTTTERSIVGESLAGLFIVETLFRAPDMFQHYIAFDPSLWWNDGALTDSVRAFTSTMDARPRTLFVAGSDDAIATGTTPFADSLNAAARPGLTFIYVPRPDLVHPTIFRGTAPAALARVLK